MAMTNARRGTVVLGLVAAVCSVWLTWAWSPALENAAAPRADDAGEAAPEATRNTVLQPQPAPVVKPSLAPLPPPTAPAPAQAPAEADPALQQPERIPTPHLMSLDQTKPPEPSGPLAELKNQYASESRSAASSINEAKLRKLVTEARNVPSELVQGISCRRTICKIETHWIARRRIGFAVVLESFKQLYNQRVAVEPAQERSPDGTYVATLYLQITP